MHRQKMPAWLAGQDRPPYLPRLALPPQSYDAVFVYANEAHLGELRVVVHMLVSYWTGLPGAEVVYAASVLEQRATHSGSRTPYSTIKMHHVSKTESVAV